MIETLKSAAVSCVVSAVISGVGVFYLQRYLDAKRKESEERAAQRRRERRKADLLESKRRRAAGRMFFWMHYGLVHGVERANGDLERAFEDYNAAEEEQNILSRIAVHSAVLKRQTEPLRNDRGKARRIGRRKPVARRDAVPEREIESLRPVRRHGRREKERKRKEKRQRKD